MPSHVSAHVGEIRPQLLRGRAVKLRRCAFVTGSDSSRVSLVLLSIFLVLQLLEINTRQREEKNELKTNK